MSFSEKIKINNLIVLIISLVFQGCISQKVEIFELNTVEMEPGKCYISVAEPISDPLERGKRVEKFILELVPGTYETYAQRYDRTDYVYAPQKESPRYESIQTSPPKIVLSVEPVDLSNLKNAVEFEALKDPVVCHFCITEYPGEYQKIDLTKIDDGFYTIEKKRYVEFPKLKKTNVRKKPKALSEHQYYFEGINWSALKTAWRKRAQQ